MLRTWFRQLVVVLTVLVIASCSGGGCSSGCAGCGVTPLPGGFEKGPNSGPVTNAASVRVTRSGLDFVGTNLGTVAAKLVGGGMSNGYLSFDVPKSTSQTSLGPFNFTIDICPAGPNPNANPPTCKVEVMLGNAKLRLDAASYASAGGKPAVRISGTIPLRVKDLPIDVTILGAAKIGVGAGQCDGQGFPQYDYFDFPIEVVLPLVSETVSPRDGYTKVDVDNAVINPTINQNNIGICKDCPQLIQGVCNGLFNFIRNLVFNQIKDPLINQLKSLLKDNTCTKPTMGANPPCPFGSSPVGGKCMYTAMPNTCVPVQLGMDGHVDLGRALSSFSPGTFGGLDIVLAAGGNMDPAPGQAPNGQQQAPNNGITLGMLGGSLPKPQSACVPFFDAKPPTGIPIPDEIKANTITPWPTGQPDPHVGIALSGRFLEYALAGVYNSGLLCLGVSTEQVAQLQSGLVSVIIPGVKKLTFEQKAAPIAITTRPQEPPKVKLGGGTDVKTDPLLTLQMNRFAIDFYVWSMDRYVRAFTFTGDLTVPVNLSTAKTPQNPNGGLLPTIGDVGVANPVVTNSDLLLDDPKLVATSLAGLLGGLAGQFVGALNPIDLSGSLSSVGLALTIPDTGIRKLTKDSDDFLGIFANLALSMNAVQEADVEARITSKTVVPEAMKLATMDRDKRPVLHALLSSSMDDGTRAVEYAWAIDGARSGWGPGGPVDISHDILFLQGKHVLKVWARVKGQPQTESSKPAEVPFVIDVLPPEVSVKTVEGRTVVDAWDVVSDTSALVARFRKDDGAFGPWVALSALDLGDLSQTKSVTVEVKDEEGNVGTVTQGLIRGRADGTIGGSGGCGCSTPGQRAPIHFAHALVVLGAIAALGRLRRRKEADAPFAGEAPSKGTEPGPRTGRARALRAPVVALGALVTLAALNPGCDCGGNGGPPPATCGPDCKTQCEEGLPKGLVGAYTSVAVNGDDIWVAGYNDAVLTADFNSLYGDLVVGRYDRGKQEVAWQTVDGVPERTDGTCVDYDPRGWRKGELEPGPNVGLWTSLQILGGRPMVAYYDATNAALKFAWQDGNNWQTHTVLAKPGADAGRYAKLVIENGKPTVAFLVMEKGMGGRTRSKVVVARATKELPQAGTDWTFQDAAVDESATCRPQFCDLGQVCVKDTGACQPTVGGCTPQDCGSGKACVTVDMKATCANIVPKDGTESYPNAVGLYVALATGPKGLGIALYDRVRGNLLSLYPEGGAWKTQILDGQTGANTDPMRVDTGDVGVATSLAIASNGDWHVAYVNGITEALQYITVPGGGNGKPLAPEIVDDGLDGGKPFADGKHVVGDDAAIQVDASGTVTIAYQDATAGTLKIATGSLQAGGTHKWTTKVVPQPGKFAGFFPKWVPGKNQVVNFWRQTDRTAGAVTGNVSLVQP
jgi:MYXO-CTERM domain-containing protein